MDTQQLNRRSTGWTLVWFVALAGAWQLAPIPASWKILPDPRNTFLLQGWKQAAPLAGPLDSLAGMAPPPLPPEDDDEDLTPLELSVQPPLAPGGIGSTTAVGLAAAAPTFAPGRHLEPQASGTLGPDRLPPAAAAPTSSPTAASKAVATYSGQGLPVIGAVASVQPIEQGCIEPLADGCAQVALEPFFRMLERTARRESGAVTRITHFGDSIIASDYISATVRSRLQREWGDSGHGFLLAAKPWRWYDHRGVVHQASAGWAVHGVTSRRFPDNLFGLGGVAFEASGPDLTADYGTARTGHRGRAVSRFEVYYQEQPDGGSVDLLINGRVRERLRMRGEVVRSAYHEIDVPDGPATLAVRTVGDGTVRLFGVTLERTTPGIVYDSVGIVGGSVGALRRVDSKQWLEQLRHRSPNLVIFSFGANESMTYEQAGPRVLRDYEHAQASLIRMVRAALPQTSVLVMGPLDAAERTDQGVITRPSIPKMVAAQRRAALSSGAAFWNTFEAMGGEGSMARWVQSRLGSSDFVHPSWGGAVMLGNALAKSLLDSFHQYEQGKNVEAGPPVRAGHEPDPSPAMGRGALMTGMRPGAAVHQDATSSPAVGSPPSAAMRSTGSEAAASRPAVAPSGLSSPAHPAIGEGRTSPGSETEQGAPLFARRPRAAHRTRP